MINKVHLSVMSPQGVKELDVIKCSEDGFVVFDNDDVKYCKDFAHVYSNICVVFKILSDNPSYENK